MRHLTTFKLIDAVARMGSIRKAAEVISITPSALHRRIQTFEEELGELIFERLPQGVRLNAAGELAIHHIRSQIADTERLRSRLADLSGVRRGHVSIACSQALISYFLPKEIARYRQEFPEVTFEVQVLDHRAAEEALIDYSVDLAIVFDSAATPEFEVTTAVRQDLRAIMAADHPLASKQVLRLRDCLDFPLALPTSNLGGRQLLQKSVAATSLELVPTIESNSFEYLKKYLLEESAVSFQIPIGAPDNLGGEDGLVSCRLDERDVLPGLLYFGQKRNRILPVASARFADHITVSLADKFQML